MHMTFWKNHFLFQNMIYHQRSTASLARLVPELRIFIPVVLTIIETGIRNSKKFNNDRNNVKPSRGVILCHIVTIKNIKLGILQKSPNFSKKIDQLTWTISQPGYLKLFRLPFVKKTNSCRISRKSVRFEL